jgi:hypothetical protein
MFEEKSAEAGREAANLHGQDHRQKGKKPKDYGAGSVRSRVKAQVAEAARVLARRIGIRPDLT